MRVYVLNLFFVWIMSVLAVKTKNKNSFDNNFGKPNKVFVVPSLLSLILICGLRWKVGTDFTTYIYMYNDNFRRSFLEVIKTEDPGFAFLQWLTSRHGYHPEHMFMFFAIIITSIAVYVIYKHSRMFDFSMFLYIAGMTYYSQFNGIRQSLAAMILLLALQYIIEKKYFKYLLVVLLASSVHISAILLAMIYFVVRKKPWSKVTLIMILGVVLVFSFFPQVMELISNYGGRYEAYGDNARGYSSYGVKPIRVMVAFVPVLMSFLFNKKLLASNKNNYILVNFSLLNFLIIFVAMKNVGLSRLSMYFSFYNILLIPEFIKIFELRYHKILYYIAVVLFFAFMLILVRVESNLIPYQTIFSR